MHSSRKAKQSVPSRCGPSLISSSACSAVLWKCFKRKTFILCIFNLPKCGDLGGGHDEVTAAINAYA
jgi:hypothetical protein